jgi:hypothetical protein
LSTTGSSYLRLHKRPKPGFISAFLTIIWDGGENTAGELDERGGKMASAIGGGMETARRKDTHPCPEPRLTRDSEINPKPCLGSEV